MLTRLISRFRRPAPASFTAALAPDAPLAVIGDVHGCDSLLAGLLARLAEEAPDHRIVLAGDLVDRGEQSAEVLRRARTLDAEVLMGNHEAMMLAFLEHPRSEGPRWLANGGLQTLASFGIGGLGLAPAPEALREAAAALREAMGPELLDWLAARPMLFRSGNVAVIHAGGEPGLPIDEQPERASLWGSPSFLQETRADGIWVVRGHVIVPEPQAAEGRISIDTGAFATGCLSAALIGAGGLHFLQHRADKTALIG
ncbi:metallophosphoesterase [Pseudoroseicyclus sp. CXY001]|uniref:metallophosphoesterase n=1 Tax=Pseudoroseicyclus sp. CXY001 TaxID=3242492 RepID=UPI0035715804